MLGVHVLLIYWVKYHSVHVERERESEREIRERGKVRWGDYLR